jgi:hypothetical protein
MNSGVRIAGFATSGLLTSDGRGKTVITPTQSVAPVRSYNEVGVTKRSVLFLVGCRPR